MDKRRWRGLARDSTVIVVVIGIAASVFANSITDALNANPRSWLYILAASLLCLLLVAIRVAVHLGLEARRLEAEAIDLRSRLATGIEVLKPGDRLTLGDLIPKAHGEMAFLGIIAKRSVSDDAFRRAIESRHGRPLRMKFLLLDPASASFATRAQEEGEDADAWKSDLQATKARLKGYTSLLGLQVELRLTVEYPLWRAIIIDNDSCYINTFLPRKRGTETLQYVMHRQGVELAYGWNRYFQELWNKAKEVPL